ncbi:hypothetical protein MRB53_019865 [Persea americana]|uniref:Uncharacterized protein n=1 Tax=Persea americana TaxID=3435 RepID=A0ACC2KZY6_PERAE|nr:hypothetical protein MRB53_019865 [Persea americana]
MRTIENCPLDKMLEGHSNPRDDLVSGLARSLSSIRYPAVFVGVRYGGSGLKRAVAFKFFQKRVLAGARDTRYSTRHNKCRLINLVRALCLISFIRCKTGNGPLASCVDD